MTRLKLEAGELRAVNSAPQQEISLSEWISGVRPEGVDAALVLPNDASPFDNQDAIGAFATVILEFPKFADGRAYSQAVELRMRLGYRGELRARGDVLCDQALFMARCGFDSFEIGDADVNGFQRALSAFSAFYQTSADKAAPVWRLRASAQARRRAA